MDGHFIKNEKMDEPKKKKQIRSIRINRKKQTKQKEVSQKKKKN